MFRMTGITVSAGAGVPHQPWQLPGVETHVFASPSATRQRGDRSDRPLRGCHLRQVLAHGAPDARDRLAGVHGPRPARGPARYAAAPNPLTPGDVRRLVRPLPAGG